jgi:hypothetical protein
MAAKWLTGYAREDITHICMRFHHSTQTGAWFKSCDLFISGNFHLMFSDDGNHG